MKIVDFRDRLSRKGKFGDRQIKKDCEKEVYKMWISSRFVFHILVHIEIVENLVEKREGKESRQKGGAAARVNTPYSLKNKFFRRF